MIKIKYYQTLLVTCTFILFACSCNSIEDGRDTADAEELEHWEEPMVEIETRALTEDDFIAARKGEYIISYGDLFEIMIEGQPDTAVTLLPLTPNGYLHYLLCEPFKAEGLTVNQLKKKLAMELNDYFLKPFIFLDLLNESSNNYYILGQVNAPGNYHLELPVRLRDAIYIAGGTSKGTYRGDIAELANLNASYVVRDGKKLEVDFAKLVYENDPKENIYVRPNDYIYVAPLKAKEVYILGAVAPRAFYHTDDLTILQVISTVNYSQDATQDKAIILRNRLSENAEHIVVNLKEILSAKAKDVYLQPDDIIYIPEKPYLFVRNLIKSAVRAYVGAFASDASSYIATEHVFDNDQNN